jgi:hypothetical protein
VPHQAGKLPEYLGGEFRLAATDEHTRIRIGSRELDLGAFVSYIRRCRLVNPEDVQRDVPESGTTLDIKLLPGEHAYQALGGIEQAERGTSGA